MKKITVSVGLLFSTMVFSQSYVGFLNDNYNGVHAVINNPANIVDSPYRSDINLFGVSAFGSNDYARANFYDLIKIKDFDLDWDSDVTKNPLSKNNAIVNLDILGPSFMFNLKPKHSIAISTRVRSIANLKDVNVTSFEKLKDGFNREKDYNIPLGNSNGNGHIWGELGLTYATVLIDEKQHFLKGGLTLKSLQGLAYVKGNGTDVDLNYSGELDENTNVDDILEVVGKLNYAYTNNIEDFDIESFGDAKGFGADLGFTYEWRPEVDKYTYVNKDEQTMYYRDVNKYKLKVGLSVTDIGSIKYKKAKQETYTATKPIIQTLPDIENLTETLTLFFGVPTSSNEVTAKLPTAIHFSADWNINQRFYLNLDTNFDVSNDKKGNSIENAYSLTPRYERKWFSAYVPMSIRQYSGFNAGFGLRAGPLYIGSGSVLTNLLAKESKSTDVYLGLKIPIYQSRPKDKDEDGIFNEVDNCPKEAGPIENDGCPWGDKDEDGITDNLDECPNIKGLKEFNGCLDTDEDGVPDKSDKCPKIKGNKEFGGCPDTDGDGVPDKSDKCPKVKGDKEFGGCPIDSDGDGVLDSKDECIDEAGPASNNGCPEAEEVKEVPGAFESILFNLGKTSFKSGVIRQLESAVEIMNQLPEATNFAIEGYADSTGSEVINQEISERRATVVKAYFISKGIDASRLNSSGFGGKYPIDSNKTRAGREKNRRVEIKLKK